MISSNPCFTYRLNKIMMRNISSGVVLGMLALMLMPLSASDQVDTQLPVVVVEKQTMPLEQYVDGVIEAVNQSTISAQTSGTVLRLHFDVNDYVKKDDVIVELSNTEQKAAVAKAEAGLSAALAQEREARSEHARLNEIFKQGAISKSQMDKARAALKSTTAGVDAARAGLAQALEQLAYTVIRAPYSGIVTQRHVEVGEAVGSGKPIMTGLSLEDLRVLANIPQRLVNAVTRYRQARVIVVNGEELQNYASSLITLFPFANTQSHAMAVRVELPANIEGLYPGMYVKVAFVVGEHRRMLIPLTAIVRRSEVTAVYVQETDGFISMRQIRAGRVTTSGEIEILAGLDVGERVILEPDLVLERYKKQRGD